MEEIKMFAGAERLLTEDVAISTLLFDIDYKLLFAVNHTAVYRSKMFTH